MKKMQFALLVVVFLLVACGAPQQPVLVEPEAELVESQAVQEDASPLPTATLMPAETSLPTLTRVAVSQPVFILPAVESAPSVEYEALVDAYRIRFEPGGTWTEVKGSLSEGETKRYVLSAMQGQVMSVAIEESWPFYLSVSDASGQLGEPDYEKPFWRGALPSTGDYFVTLQTQWPGEYTLRVAINPPESPYQYFGYSHPDQLFSLRYSDEFSTTTFEPVGEFKGTPALVLGFINPEFYNPVTNLSEAYVLINTSQDRQLVSTCTDLGAQMEFVLGQQTINGTVYTISQFVGVGAGNIYEQLIYRTVHNSTCFEAVLFMHSSNIGNYPSGSVVEFDRAALVAKFEEILFILMLE